MLTKGLAFLAIIASFAVGKSFHFQVAGHLHEFLGQSLRQFWVNLGQLWRWLFFNKCFDNWDDFWGNFCEDFCFNFYSDWLSSHRNNFSLGANFLINLGNFWHFQKNRFGLAYECFLKPKLTYCTIACWHI